MVKTLEEMKALTREIAPLLQELAELISSENWNALESLRTALK